MKPFLLLPVLLTLTLQATEPAEEKLSAPLQDLTSPDSPLLVTGDATFYSVEQGQNLVTREGLNARLANRSGKPILAFETVIDLVPPGGAGTQRNERVDYFLADEMLQPGAEYLVEIAPDIRAVGARPQRAVGAGAQAHFRLLFAQFADGSTFGKSEWGTGLAKERKEEVSWLNALLKQYEDGQESALAASVTTELSKHNFDQSLYFLLDQIKTKLARDGAESVAKYMRTSLENAGEHPHL